MKRPECEKFTGRRRDICNGEADLSLQKINIQRARWNFPPLSEFEYDPKPRSQQTQVLSKKTGPGSELSKLLSTFGIKPRADCSCNLLINTMDSLGPAGCRQNKEKLLKLMRKNQDKYGWGSYLRAGFNAVRTGWVFKLNPLDPLPQLFDEAVRLAEQNQ